MANANMRSALKEALLDLRSQLQGRKASAYVKKIEKEHEKNCEGESEKDSDTANAPSPKPSRDSERTQKAKAEASDFSEDFKAFLSKKKRTPGINAGAAPSAKPQPENLKLSQKGKTK